MPNLPAVGSASPDGIKGLPPEVLFDFLAVRLNGPRASGRKIRLNLKFTDLGREYGLVVENGVLNHGKPLTDADVTLTLARATL